MPRAAFTPALKPPARVASFQHAMARRLGFLILPAAVIVVAWLVLPHAGRVNERGMLALLAAGAVLAGILLDGRLLGRRHGIAVVLGVASVITSIGVALSGDAQSVFMLLYFWSVSMAFGLLPLRAAAVQAAIMAAGFGLALVTIEGDSGREVTWLALVVSVLAVGGLVRSLSGSARAAEEHFRRAFEGAPVGMVLTDLDLRVVRANEAFGRFLGRDAHELAGRHVGAFSHPEDMAANLEHHRDLLDGLRSSYEMEKRYLRADGSIVWGMLRVSLVRDDRGRPRSLHGQVEDITDRRRASELLDRRARYGEAAAELGRMALTATGVADLAGHAAAMVAEQLEVESSAVMEVIGEELHMLAGVGPHIGRDPGERWLMRPRSLGRRALDFDGPLTADIRGGDIEASAELLASAVETAMAVSVDGRAGPLGLLCVFSPTLRAFTPQEADFLHVVGNVMGSAIDRDVREADALHRALHDPLTGLPNRDLFADRLEITLARARRGGQLPAVLIVDLDHFKVVNDSLGHQAGDELLCAIAPRLADSLREIDTVARFGGDEFVVLCDGVHDERAAMVLAQRLAAVLDEPVELAGSTVYVTASVGVTVAGPESDVESLIRDADAALYRAKELGRGRCELFDAELRALVTARLDLQIGLRSALENGELAMHYQPMVDLETGRPLALEALMRWEHPTRGSVGPAEFIPVAEESGLIVPIGHWALRQVCAFAATPEAAGLSVSVNVSVRQLAQPGIVDAVAGALAESGIAPHRLWLELTESALLEEGEAPFERLHELKALGVALVLDDFGTGYSSLAYLQRFPLDALKVDRAFVAGITEDGRAAALVEAVVTMARTLGLQVIPEGIETHAQRDALLALGCRYGQGYLFGRPAASSELTLAPLAA